MRSKLIQTENTEKEMRLELELLRSNASNNFYSQQTFINYGEKECADKSRTQKEQERASQDYWELRERLRVESLKRGELEN
jgi:hypothetical protein